MVPMMGSASPRREVSKITRPSSALLTIGRTATQHYVRRYQVAGRRILEASAQAIVVADERMRRTLGGIVFGGRGMLLKCCHKPCQVLLGYDKFPKILQK